MKDHEIKNNAPKKAVTFSLYDYESEMKCAYLNSENEFHDIYNDRWVAMSSVDNEFHGFRSIADIKELVALRKTKEYFLTQNQRLKVVITERETSIDELEEKQTNLKAKVKTVSHSSAENYGLYCELLFSPNDPPENLEAHNLQIRKQTVAEVLRYMEHSDVFIEQSDVDGLMTELDVYKREQAEIKS